MPFLQQHSRGASARNWQECYHSSFQGIHDWMFFTFKDFCLLHFVSIMFADWSCPALLWYLFLFTHPATVFIYCTVKNGPPFLTALICLHVHKYVYFHRRQSHIFQACHRCLGLRLLLYPCLPFHLHCQVTSFKPVTIIFASVCLLISVSIVC